MVIIMICCTSQVGVAAAASPEAVADVSGRKVRAGTEYYILPANILGRGLTLAGRNKTCPFTLVLTSLQEEYSPGLPVTFHPINPKKGVVRLSTDLNLVFSAATVCAEPTVWRLGVPDAHTGIRYVGVGGSVGNPGGATVTNWFTIEKFGKKSYKLSFCPTVCLFCKMACGDVGIVWEGGRGWLAITNKPIPIIFRKVRRY